MWILVIKIMSTKLVIKEWFTTQLYESAMDSTPRLTMINPLFSWPSWSAHYRALQPSNSHVTLIHCSTQHKENYVAWVQEPGGRVHKPMVPVRVRVHSWRTQMNLVRCWRTRVTGGQNKVHPADWVRRTPSLGLPWGPPGKVVQHQKLVEPSSNHTQHLCKRHWRIHRRSIIGLISSIHMKIKERTRSVSQSPFNFPFLLFLFPKKKYWSIMPQELWRKSYPFYGSRPCTKKRKIPRLCHIQGTFS